VTIKKDDIEKTYAGNTTVSMSIPKGILLIIALFLMLGGAKFQGIIYVALPIDYEWKSALINLLFVVLGPVYLLVAYSLFTQQNWSRKFTMIVSSLDALYGFISAALTVQMLSMVLRTSNASTTAMLVGVNVYNLVVAILMLFVIRYLRRPDVKEWFVSSNKEEQIESPS